MPTTNQLVRKGRRGKKKRSRAKALRGNPQVSAVVLRVFVIKPRKPNSGWRKMARVLLKTGIEVTAFIPGEGHNVQEHATVLVRAGGRPDLPGIKYQVIRGVRDVKGVEGRKKSRSRYGTKKAKK